jgi:leukotriene-A4 hydrolase
VPYEKGSNFLYFLETKLGGPEKMDHFLKAYIKRFSYKSITTSDFQDFVYEFFSDKKDVLDQIEWESWYSLPGMPLTGNT